MVFEDHWIIRLDNEILSVVLAFAKHGSFEIFMVLTDVEEILNYGFILI